MKEMKKDERIENAFLGYFGGVEAPPCDLTQAKRALPQRARRKGRGVLWKAASAFACFLVVCAVSVGILLGRPGTETGGSAEGDAPSQTVPSYYALSSAQAEHASYAQLSQRYEEQLNALSPFEWADNAQAEYTLCSVGGEEALIVAHIRYLYGFVFWEGELYIDLTGGAQLPEELRAFEELESGGTVAGYPYAYAARYVGGEYVSDARLSLPAADYYMTVTGRSEDAAFALLRQLAENS